MSIITEQDGVYKLYIKGADSEIIQRLCLSQPQPFLEKTQKALDDFSVSGLRTLVYAMKVLSKAEFETYWKQFNQAQISNNKQKQLAELSNYMDRNLFLIGCTAIEDNLQDKVPESIQRFYEANIRVWMITGDKLETAENIARCAGIITPGTEAFRFKLNTDSSQEFVDKIKKLKREVQSAPDDARKAIVIDTARLGRIFLTVQIRCLDGTRKMHTWIRVTKTSNKPLSCCNKCYLTWMLWSVLEPYQNSRQN